MKTTANPNGVVRLTNVRIAFPELFEAKAFEGGKPAFSATLIFPTDHEANEAIDQAIEAVAQARWKDKAPTMLRQLRASGKVCLRDGETKGDLAGFAGNNFVTARAYVRPTVIDRDRTPLHAEDGRIYGGCYVNAIIQVWAQDNGFGKRVNASLKGVQFFRDGESFGGGGAVSADAFEEFSMDEFEDAA